MALRRDPHTVTTRETRRAGLHQLSEGAIFVRSADSCPSVVGEGRAELW